MAFQITRELADRALYRELDQGKSDNFIKRPSKAIDALTRLWDIHEVALPLNEDLTVTIAVSCPNRRYADFYDKYALSFRFEENDNSYVAFSVDTPRLSDHSDIFRTTVATNDAVVDNVTGRNFSLNLWRNYLKYIFKIEIYKRGQMFVTIDNYYTMSTVNFKPKQFKYLKIIKMLITSKRITLPTDIDKNIVDVFSVDQVIVNGITKQSTAMAVEPSTRSVSRNLGEIIALPDSYWVQPTIDQQTVPENTTVPPLVGQQTNSQISTSDDSALLSPTLTKLNTTTDLRDLINRESQVAFDLKKDLSNLELKHWQDDRLVVPDVAYAINGRLRKLCVEVLGSSSSEALSAFLIAMLQLMVTYTTVAGITIRPEYKVDFVYKQKNYSLQYASVVNAILGPNPTVSSDNIVRRYMRYWSPTTIRAIKQGLILPNAVLCARHGLPKQYLAFGFDFTHLDSRYYTADELKAASLATSYALRFAEVKSGRGDIHNLYFLPSRQSVLKDS